MSDESTPQDQQAPSMDETAKFPSFDTLKGAGAPAEPGFELAKAQKERDDFKTAYMRALADFDNFQKRTKRENERYREEALRDILKDLVLVLDNLDMTLTAAKPEAGAAPADLGSVVHGVELVRAQLLKTVGQRGLVPLGTKPGDAYDSEKHEAVMAVPTPGLAQDEVGLVAREGYRLGAAVLRPASVQVKKAGS